MEMTPKSIVAVCALFCLIVSAAAGLESNPITKINKYLSAKTNSLDPAENIKLAEEYYEREKVNHSKLKSNKKLLESLELFTSLKSLINGDKHSCQSDEVDLIKNFKDNLELHAKGFDHLQKVFAKIKESYLNDCREAFYSRLDDQLNRTDLDQSFFKSLEIMIEKRLDPEGNFLGKYYTVKQLWDIIIYKKLGPYLVQEAMLKEVYPDCKKRIPKLAVDETFRRCLVSPCRQYVENFRNVFELADRSGLRPEPNAEENPKSVSYFLHFAEYRMCQSIAIKGAVNMMNEIRYEPPISGVLVIKSSWFH